MGKKDKHEAAKHDDTVDNYDEQLYALQVQLVKFQRQVIRDGLKVLVVIEGRDGAGKDGAIKRITEHMSPRETRVVALAKPSDREQSSWYFQRYAAHLPAGGEVVFFNRSWYNRAGVERVMGFCSDEEYEEFMEDAPRFEELLIRSGVILRKYYLDISKGEQKKRLEERKKDPLKQWKVSPIDAVAVKNWNRYSEARNLMFARTHTAFAPWMVVATDEKKAARLNLIKDLLAGLDYKGKDHKLLVANPEVVFDYSEEALERGLLSK